MQTKDDGKHDILPVAVHVMTCRDHAGVPVMLPRDSDGRVRRDGSEGARAQAPGHANDAVDERGRVHGALDLAPPAEADLAENTPCRLSKRKDE